MQCRHGEFAAALAGLERVEQLAPGRFTTELVRGAALLAAAQPGAAKKALTRFLIAHPNHVRALVLRAHAAQDLGNQAACLADYRAALQATATPEPDLVRETADALSAAGQANKTTFHVTDGTIGGTAAGGATRSRGAPSIPSCRITRTSPMAETASSARSRFHLPTTRLPSSRTRPHSGAR